MMLLSKKLCNCLLALPLLTPGFAYAQSLTIVSGNGQLVGQFFPATAPLVVLLKDRSGNPIANQPVTWTVSASAACPQPCNTFGSVSASTTNTDSTGQSSNTFLGGQILQPNAFSQSVVTVTASGATAQFTESTFGIDTTGVPFVQIFLDYPTLTDVVTGPAGGTGSTPIKVRVLGAGNTAQANVGIPGVGVRVSQDSSTGPTVSCQGGIVLTDSTGAGLCTPLFGSTVGSGGRFTITVGEIRTFSSAFSVTVGQPSVLRISGGDGQSGTPGIQLPVPLVAIVQDAGGNPIAGVPVAWDVPQGTVTLNNVSTASDANGRVSAIAVLGNNAGPAQVRVRTTTGSLQAIFNLTINISVTGLIKTSGDNQTAVTSAAFASPLIVQVTTGQGNPQGITVQFTVTSGSVTLSASSATTDQQGHAQVTVTAGASPGTAVVTATTGNFSATFNLTVRLPGPAITTSSFFNAAGGQPGGVSPSALVAIYGAGLATGIQGCVLGSRFVGPWPFVVASVSMQFGNSFAPIYAVCNFGPGQEYVVAQVPSDLPLGPTTVIGRVGSGSTTVNNVPVTAVSIGIFQTTMSDNKQRAVLIRPDGSFVSLQNPARKGENVRAFVTGIGTPAQASGLKVGTNSVGVPGFDATPPYPVIVGVNNNGAPFISAIASTSIIGVVEVTFTIPPDASSGQDIPFAIAVTINDQFVFGNPSAIPIQ